MDKVTKEELLDTAYSLYCSKKLKKEINFNVREKLEAFNEAFLNMSTNVTNNELSDMQLLLYVIAIGLKEEFLKKAASLAKDTNTFFKWTISVNWIIKSEFVGSESKNTLASYGYLGEIFWSEKIGIKERNKKTRFIYKKIKNFGSDKNKVSIRSFKNISVEEKNLIAEYEELFSRIRTIQQDLSELKKKNYLTRSKFNFFIKKIQNKDYEDEA